MFVLAPGAADIENTPALFIAYLTVLFLSFFVDNRQQSACIWSWVRAAVKLHLYLLQCPKGMFVYVISNCATVVSSHPIPPNRPIIK